ncbi:MAG: hypothetical protein K6T85_19695 [Gorillibacterium sp.]|nr:hypothetical protein [Gorillibacterium sp.]
MSKKIQAYFHTENDAVAASTRLQAYGLEQLEVSELPESIDGNVPLLIPLGAGLAPGPSGIGGGIPVGNVGAAGSSTAAGSVIAGLGRDEDRGTSDAGSGVGIDQDDSSAFFNGDRADIRYVLSAKVRDEVHDEVIEIIRSNNGYIEVFK